MQSQAAARTACIVILDNFEQVAQVRARDGWPMARARTTCSISRDFSHTLRIAGEAIVSVSTLTAQEAQTLFVERATAARHDLVISEADRPVVQEIVALLDGLPLAIELAAARVRIMSPARLRERMDQRFRMLGAPNGFRERHATLRAAFDWSWDLLADEEKSALARLSIFRGGFDLQAAEAILFESSGQAMACVDLVQSLVDKSLLKSNAAERFELLTTLQEYAAEQLSTPGRYASSGADACTRAEARHFQYFAQLGEVRATLGKCADIENLVAATQRAVAHGDARAATATPNRAPGLRFACEAHSGRLSTSRSRWSAWQVFPAKTPFAPTGWPARPSKRLAIASALAPICVQRWHMPPNWARNWRRRGHTRRSARF